MTTDRHACGDYTLVSAIRRYIAGVTGCGTSRPLQAAVTPVPLPASPPVLHVVRDTADATPHCARRCADRRQSRASVGALPCPLVRCNATPARRALTLRDPAAGRRHTAHSRACASTPPLSTPSPR